MVDSLADKARELLDGDNNPGLSMSDLAYMQTGVTQEDVDATVAAKLPKTARGTTGSVGTTANVNVALTWPTAFADTNYTVAASVLDDSAGDSLRVTRVRSLTTTGCVVNVINNSLSTRTGIVHAIAVPD